MAKTSPKIPPKVKSEAKKAVKKSVRRHPVLWLLIILVIAVVIFVITPVKNPLKTTQPVFDSVAESLAIPAYGPDDIIVRHTGYTLSYSEEHEQPLWVAYLLTADEVFAGLEDRNDNFREDPAVPTGSATLSDYRGSGYDRGHLCPAADQSWSAAAMDDSFYLSNMSPQTHAFNAGIWLNLESAIRTFAAQNQEICVVTGPVLTDGPYKTIGANKVSVPLRFYKVVLDYYGTEKKAIGFVMAQDDKGSLRNFAMSVDDVEKITGLDFFPSLPDDEEEALESEYHPSAWDMSDFSRTMTARRYGYDLENASYSADSVAVVPAAEPQGVWENIRYFLFVHVGPAKRSVLEFLESLGMNFTSN
ncbi:MAG: DNA/RNA non-specific endonuclease [Spirochaetales bacterium]|nr:DNA/RNA non-specific endonuclease [Spirochaetales bacterium]